VIVLDTNVLSEMVRPTPEPRVLDWLAAQPRASVFTTTVTRAELLYGVRVLPDGKRQSELLSAIRAILDEEFAGQVLAFDTDAADAFALIAATRKHSGQPISQFDAMIAGIAHSRGAGVATRNAGDFLDCGIEITNPWTD